MVVSRISSINRMFLPYNSPFSVLPPKKKHQQFPVIFKRIFCKFFFPSKMNKFPKNPPLCAGKVCLRLLPCPVDQICTSLTSSAPCAPVAVSWTPFCGMDVGSNKIAKQNSSRFLWRWSTVKKGTPLLCNEYGIPLSCAGVFQFWRRIPIWGHVFSMIDQWKMKVIRSRS